MCDGTVIDVGLGPSTGIVKMSKVMSPVKVRRATNHDHLVERSRSTSVENLEVKVDEMSITSCQSCHDGDGDCAQRSIDAGYSSETQQDNSNNSRTSSIVSTPEGSEVACSDVCCKGIDAGSFLTLEQMLVS
jgi:hypothetical protein